MGIVMDKQLSPTKNSVVPLGALSFLSLKLFGLNS